jgi:uncharacterized protein YegL
MNNQLVESLQKSLKTGSLSDLANAKKQETEATQAFLLLDCSGSMAEYCEPNRSKYQALSELVESLKKDGFKFTQVAFPWHGGGAAICAKIPFPEGGTPMHAAIELANIEDAKHVIIISDGIPDSEHSTQLAADAIHKKGVKVDVFYVGPSRHSGETFLRSLAKSHGGSFQATSLAKSQHLALKQNVKKALLEYRK